MKSCLHKLFSFLGLSYLLGIFAVLVFDTKPTTIDQHQDMLNAVNWQPLSPYPLNHGRSVMTNPRVHLTLDISGFDVHVIGDYYPEY